MANLPVATGPRAPISVRWFYYVAPPALITYLYRTLLPPKLRSKWCSPGRGTSHLALSAILAGYGWSAFFTFAFPRGRSGGISTDWFPKLAPGVKELPDWFPTTGADTDWLHYE